jgi:uncharacterized damage-inducible protein DinB
MSGRSGSMNRFVQEHWPVWEATQAMRGQLMNILDNGDLAYSPGGDNLSLGALCVEMGEVEHIYIQSFKTHKVDWSYKQGEPGMAGSVEKLTAWFEGLDEELNGLIQGMSDEGIMQIVDRGGGFQIPVGTQAHIYREGLLIFYGKVSVYLRGLGKTFPEQWKDWIG